MTFSPQYLVAVNLGLLALAAYSASSIVGTVIASRLAPPLHVRLSEPPPPLVDEKPKPSSHYAAIHSRDIFNSAKPAAEAPPAPPAPPPVPLNVKLWGVAVHSDPSLSWAILEDQKVRKQTLYGIDDTIEGTDAKVKDIQWDRIVLLRNGQEQILELEKPAGGLPAGAPSVGPQLGRATAPAPAPPPVAGGTSDPHIRSVGENEWVVDRSEVDRAMENMSELFTQVRAVPHFEGGKSTGFRLFAIRQGSLFDKIGLKNGDIIQKINETELNDPSKALALMQQLRNVSDLTVEVIRNRQPQTLSYRFQ